MSMPLLLDTCAVIWIATAQSIAAPAADELRTAKELGADIFISPVTAWEIGILVSKARLNLNSSPRRWFERAVAAPGIQLAELLPDVLIESSFLPGRPPRDPADRIILATAREYGYRIVTRDRLLLSYGEQGHVQTLPC